MRKCIGKLASDNSFKANLASIVRIRSGAKGFEFIREAGNKNTTAVNLPERGGCLFICFTLV